METTELNNDAYKIQWGDKELDEIKDGEGKIVWQSAYEKEKSGNGSVIFNGTRNRLVKSAVFEGETFQQGTPTPDNPQPILSNNSKWSGTGNNYVDLGDGWNLWDEEWEVGGLNSSTGKPTTSTNAIRSKNFCECLSNKDYYLRCGEYADRRYMAICWYDSNKDYISASYENSRVVTSPSNSKYFKIFTNPSTYIYGPTYNHDICINLSQPDTTKYPYDGVYRPYIEPVLGLNRIGTAVDTYDAQSGLLTRGIGVVDLGTLNWTLRTTGAKNRLYSSVLLNKYPIATQAHPYNNWLSTVGYLGASDAKQLISTIDERQQGVYSFTTPSRTESDIVYFVCDIDEVPFGNLYYELYIPTTETITPQPITQYRGQNNLTQIDGDVNDTKTTITYYGKYNN